MKQKINVLIIWIIAIIILIVSFVYAINHKKESLNHFNDSGYIISNSYQEGFNNANKLYFDKETSYKQFNKDTYTFINSEGEKVNVSEESFVHYANGSVMSLKKGVAIDLDKIDSKLISYYNIFEGSNLIKNNEVYEIENLKNIISFSKLMFKISNNKYLIASPKIVISFSDDQTVDMDDYAEIEYVDKNVIRIYNDKVNYQTIASELYLIIDNIKIDLEYKTISKNDVEYLTMADMIINSDDNIEILPEKPEIFVPGETDNSNNGSNNGGNNSGNNGGGNTSGGEIDSGVEDGLDDLIGNLPQIEDKEEKEEVIQPKFKVDSMDVTTLGFENLSLSFEDESSILFGNRTVEILENSTGKVVAIFEQWEEEIQNYTINSYFSLKPNTAYTLNVIGQYKIDEVIYDRTFISKIFRTLDIGLEITNDYITNDTLSFAIYRTSYSEVNGFTYKITDKNGNLIVEDKKTNFFESDKIIITEKEKFNSNTGYILTLKDIQYGNDVFSTIAYQALELNYETRTLKVNPFKISDIKLLGSVDSINNEVTFIIDGINDINGGIQNYVYNIYNEVDELKQTISKSDSTPVTLSFESLENAEAVSFTVAINFDDNEKTVMFMSPKSNSIELSGFSYPKIVGYEGAKDNTESEKLIGNILIDDKENYIASKGISTYKIDIKKKTNSLLGGTEQFVGSLEIQKPENTEDVEGSLEIEVPNTATTQYELPVYFEGLEPNTEYILYVYLLSEGKYIYIGYEDAKTESTKPIYLNIKQDSSVNSETMFDLEMSIDKENKNDSLNYTKQINLELYRCSEDMSICEKTDFSASVPRSQDTEDFDELYNLIYNETTLTINSSRFGYYIEDYIANSKYKVVIKAMSYRYEIPVKINGNDTNEFEITLNNVAPSLSIKSHEILNSEQDIKQEKIDDDTIVGFRFEINSRNNPMGQAVDKVLYNIYETKTYDKNTNTCEPYIDEQSSAIITKNIEIGETIQTDKVYFGDENDNLYRGVHYCMVYNGTYKGNDNEDVKTSPKTLHLFAPKQNVELEGYIKNYDVNLSNVETYDLTIKLNIDDPDSVLKSIVLVHDKDEPITAQKIDGNNTEYKFEGLKYKSYVLKITEKLGDEAIEHKISDVILDDIIEIDNIKVIVDTRSPGKIILKVPYKHEIDENIDNSLTNLNLSNNLNRVSAIGIKDNDTIRYFELIDSDAGYLYAEIGLTEIDNQKMKIGKIENGNLTLNDVYLLYDSGKIVDYLNNDNSFFIKSKNEGLNNNYFSKENYDFTYISNKSIFSINDFDFDNTYKKWNLKVNNKISLSSNIFNSIKLDPGTIGISLSMPNKTARFVNFISVEKTSKANLYDVNGQSKTEFKVTDVLSTSDIKTVYTSTGANISFNIENKEIKTPIDLIVVLNKKNEETPTELSITLNSCKANETCEWNTNSVEGTNEIKKVAVNKDGNVEIYFDEISRDIEYSYSLKFRANETTLSTYNTVKKKNNENITITTLKRLYLSSSNVEVEKKYWTWNTENKVDDFIKQVFYYFDVDEKKYELKGDEKISYELIARKEDSEEIFSIGGSSDVSNNNGINSGRIDLYKIDYVSGIYEVILQSKIESTDESKKSIDLEDISLTKITLSKASPEFFVEKISDPIFGIEINDKDGMLIACDNYENNTLMGYIDQVSDIYYKNLGRKVVYLELYSINAETNKEIFKGYSPIPFPAQTSRLDLTKYFENRDDLTTGDYKVKIQYCIPGKNEEGNEITSQLTWESEKIRINNLSGLKMQLIDVGYYFLMLKNPDPLLKDSIQEIEYQYKTYMSDVYNTKKLSNLDNITSNDIKYTASVNSDGSTIYFLGLPVDGILTSQIESLQINFKSSDGKIITTYYK